MILQEIPDEAYIAESQNTADWRTVMGSLVMAWCASQDPERALMTFKRWGVVSFTIRIKHMRPILEMICGALPSPAVR